MAMTSSDTPSHNTVLVTVTGPDTSGITAALANVLVENQVTLLDIEQVVVHGQLILALLVDIDATPARGEPVLKDLLFTARKMGLDLQFKVLEESTEPPGGLSRYAVTAISDHNDADGLRALSGVLAERSCNIETIRQLSDGRLSSVEFIVSVSPTDEHAHSLRRALIESVAHRDIDLAVQPEIWSRRSKRMVIMDMDSTLIRIEVIDELARAHGVVDRVSAITERAMAGELDFEESLRQRVALLAGMSWDKVSALAEDLPLTDGAEDMLTVLHKLGYKTGVISGGFTFAADALKKRLNLDYAYANELEVKDGALTGRVLEPIITPQRKADLFHTIAQGQGISLDQTIAIGDGANDLAMLERAGLGIAFHAKPKLKAAADTSLSKGGLDRVLYLLGLSARDVKDALAR